MYVKLSDIEFSNPDHKTICENLYKDIIAAEAKMISDEEMLEYLKQNVGDKAATYIASPTLMFNQRVLMALKVAFWYYSGKPPAQVVSEVQDDLKIDIFDP